MGVVLSACVGGESLVTAVMRRTSWKKMTLTAAIHREDNLYVAQCSEVGIASRGKTAEEAVSSLKEATELYLEEFPLPAHERSFMTTFEAVHG